MGKGGGLNKEPRECKLDYSLLVGEVVLKEGWRLAMVREDVEGRISRLLASLATNSITLLLTFFPRSILKVD